MAGRVRPFMADGFPDLVAEIDRLLDAAGPSDPLRGTVGQLPYYGRCTCSPTCNNILTAPAGSAGTRLVELERDGEAVIWLSLDPTATAIVDIEVLDPERLDLPGRVCGMNASMIRFRFGLCPLDDVSPWGGDQPRLHWFGLTEGRYWIQVGEHELLRYSRLDHPDCYIDYYLAQLWEDITVLTPDVLEPVPADLQPFITSQATQWAHDPWAFNVDGDDEVDPTAPDHPAVTAATWHGRHDRNLGYLRNPPRLRFWRTVRDNRDEITVDWRHDDDGEIGFTAGPAVQVSIPTADYRQAAHALDRELMAAMRQRVEELDRRGRPAGMTVDFAELRRDHENRARWRARNLDRTPTTDWDAVRQGARHLLGDTEQTNTPRA